MSQVGPNEVRVFESIQLPEKVTDEKTPTSDYINALADTIAAATERYGQRMPTVLIVNKQLLGRAKAAIAEMQLPIEVKTTGGLFLTEIWLGRPAGDPGQTLTKAEAESDGER